jgi:hypothetical protein
MVRDAVAAIQVSPDVPSVVGTHSSGSATNEVLDRLILSLFFFFFYYFFFFFYYFFFFFLAEGEQI